MITLKDLEEAYRLLSGSNSDTDITIMNMKTGEIHSSHKQKTNKELKQIMSDAGFTVFNESKKTKSLP